MDQHQLPARPAGGVAGGGHGHDLVALAVEDEHGEADLLQAAQRDGAAGREQHRQGGGDEPPGGEGVGHRLREREALELEALVAAEEQRLEGVDGQGGADHAEQGRVPAGEGGEVVPGLAHGGVDEDEGHGPLRLGGGQLGHQPAAERVTADHRPPDAELVEDLGQEPAVGGEAPPPGPEPLGGAVAGQVDGQHPEPHRRQPGQRLHVEPAGEREPVGHHQRDPAPAGRHADAVTVSQTERMRPQQLQRNGEGRAGCRCRPQSGCRFVVDGHRIRRSLMENSFPVSPSG